MVEYFAMGGYAAFVWTTYGLAVLALIVMVVLSRRTLHRRETHLKALIVQGRHRRETRTATTAPPAGRPEATALPAAGDISTP